MRKSPDFTRLAGRASRFRRAGLRQRPEKIPPGRWAQPRSPECILFQVGAGERRGLSPPPLQRGLSPPPQGE